MNELQLAYIPVVYLLLVGIPIVYTDLREKRIPNKLVLPATGALVLTTIAIAFITGDWLNALLTFLIAFAVFSLLTYISFRGWVGMGDVKLLVTMGIALSPFALMNWAWLGLITAGLTLLIIGYKLLANKLFRVPIYNKVALAPWVYLAYTSLVGIIIYTN
jgi:leader peptidase (prepilin peptidase)/N-methyltransferase